MAFSDFYVPSSDINIYKLEQGQIFEGLPVIRNGIIEERIAILINPICDLIYIKKSPILKYLLTVDIKAVLLDVILSDFNLSESQKEGLEPITKQKTWKSIIEKIRHFLNGDSIYRYYFLPPFKGYFELPMQMVDFQQVTSIERDYIENILKKNNEEDISMGKTSELKIVAQISTSYCAQLISRYNSYSNRVGVANYADTEIFAILDYVGLKYNQG